MMGSPAKEQKYSSLKAKSTDSEDDSDTTLASMEFLGKRNKRQRRYLQRTIVPLASTCFLWGSIIILQIIILAMLVRNTKSNHGSGWTATNTETGGDVNGLYVPSENSSLKIY